MARAEREQQKTDLTIGFAAACITAYVFSRYVGKVKPVRDGLLALSWKPEELTVPGPVEGTFDLDGKWPNRPANRASSENRLMYSSCGGCLLACALGCLAPPLALIGLLVGLVFAATGSNKQGTLSLDRQRKGLLWEVGGGTRFFSKDDLFLVGLDSIEMPDPEEAGSISADAPAIVTRSGTILRAELPDGSRATEAATRIAAELGVPLLLGSGTFCVEEISGKGTAAYYLANPDAVPPEQVAKRAMTTECLLPLAFIVGMWLLWMFGLIQ